MKEISRFTGLSGIHTQRQAPPPPPPLPPGKGPGEDYQPGQAQPNWLKKPENLEPADVRPNGSQQHGMSFGKKVGLVACGLAAGTGIGVGIAASQLPPQVPQQISNRDAQRAFDNFDYLDQVAAQNGGGMTSDSGSLLGRVLHQTPEVDANEAVTALSQGKTVYVQFDETSQPVAVHNTQELKGLTQHVRQAVVEAQMREGVEHLKEGIRNFGESIKDILR